MSFQAGNKDNIYRPVRPAPAYPARLARPLLLSYPPPGHLPQYLYGFCQTQPQHNQFSVFAHPGHTLNGICLVFAGNKCA